MKVLVDINDQQKEVSLERSGDEWTAMVDGESYRLEVSEPEKDVLLLISDGQVFEAAVSPVKHTSGNYQIRIKGQEFDAAVIDPKRLKSAAAGAGDSSGRAEIKTAMPGKVVRILVEPGQQVEKGDGVIVVEAMKMQNEMKAPKSGTVADVRAAENQTVSAGDVLVVIE